jgi:hypothetical protein
MLVEIGAMTSLVFYILFLTYYSQFWTEQPKRVPDMFSVIGGLYVLSLLTAVAIKIMMAFVSTDLTYHIAVKATIAVLIITFASFYVYGVATKSIETSEQLGRE